MHLRQRGKIGSGVLLAPSFRRISLKRWCERLYLKRTAVFHAELRRLAGSEAIENPESRDRSSRLIVSLDANSSPINVVAWCSPVNRMTTAQRVIIATANQRTHLSGCSWWISLCTEAEMNTAIGAMRYPTTP